MVQAPPEPPTPPQDSSENDRASYEYLAEELRKAVHIHQPLVDAWFYNGLTAAALVASAAATVIPAEYDLLGKVSAAVATLLIALLRAFDFGARWRWRKSMRYAYVALRDELEEAWCNPSKDGRSDDIRKVYGKLRHLRGQEDRIPGSGYTPGEPGSEAAETSATVS